MRTGPVAVLCLSGAMIAACGGSSPSGPSGGGNSGMLEGRVFNAIDGAASPGLTVAVGPWNTTADSNGYFRVDVGRASTYKTRVHGNGIVQRETNISGPGAEPVRVSLIPTSFDLDSFNEMFRPSGPLQRWTGRPGLVVLATVMTYYKWEKDEFTATADRLTDEDVELLVSHLTEGLSILSSGTFTGFASVEIERPASGARASVSRPGKIVVGRYTGIEGHTNTVGYGQWALAGDGSVGAGAMFLDSDFDKRDNRRRLLRIHELGHALGLMHVTNRTSIMNPALGPDVTDFDRAAATVAFQRPPGNRAPDVDPSDAPAIHSTHRRTLEWGPPVFCR